MDSFSVSSSKPSATDYELTLSQIRGVYASCVILDASHDLSEVHVVASTERKPKQIVRDIETLFYVKHRVKIDYRKVSLVQVPDEKLLRIPIARPEIRGVTEELVGDKKRIRVEIQGGSKNAFGQAEENIDSPSTNRTAAYATIAAIEKLLNHRIKIRLDNLTAFRFDLREVLIVIVTCQIEDREESFVGASFAGNRPSESAARATLDALNRRIYNLTFQAPRELVTDD